LGSTLCRSGGHGVGEGTRACVLGGAQLAGVTREQARAYVYAKGPGGLALIDRQAGTGKSYTL
jgi:hypothetical protein